MQRVATRKEDNEHSVEWEIEDAGEQPLRPTTPLHLEGKTFDNAVLNPKAPIRGWTLRQVGILLVQKNVGNAFLDNVQCPDTLLPSPYHLH